jgi:serine/threonine-protein kinase
LDNEHIAAVLDFDQAADGAPFLVMEYLHGESLATTLRREGVLPVPRALGILLQACDGLAAAHEAGIVHRDLKPDNLFLVERPDRTELLKILDFGVAKLVRGEPSARDTQSGAVLGTPLYMAPEQARGEKTVDFRVDIHALGVIAYELLSGERPHPGDGYNAILAHILTRPARPLRELRPELPDDFLRVIERAMAFDPKARYQSAAELASALSPFAGRKVASRAAQFDLRRPHDVKAGAATLATPSDTRAPADGTLQSAVGDARTASGSGTRRLWPWGLLLAGGASFSWMLLAGERQPPASVANGHVLTSPVVVPTPSLSATDRVVPAVTAKPLSSTPVAEVSAGVAEAEAKPKPSAETAKRRPRAPVSGRSKVMEGQGEVTFDEKNPY